MIDLPGYSNMSASDQLIWPSESTDSTRHVWIRDAIGTRPNAGRRLIEQLPR